MVHQKQNSKYIMLSELKNTYMASSLIQCESSKDKAK